MFFEIDGKFIKLNPNVIFLYFILLFLILFSRKSLTLTILCFALILILTIFYTKKIILFKKFISLIFIFAIPFILNYIFTRDIYNSFKSSFLITSFVLAFICFNNFIDDAKIFHIFYKFLPKTALVLSISVRYYNLIVKKFNSIYECFKVNNNLDKTFKKNLTNSIDIFLSISNQTLEDSIVLANSIKSKSYLTLNRTYYNIYSFKIKDIVTLLLISFIFMMFKISNNYFFIILYILIPIIYDLILNIWRFFRCQLLA